MQIILGWIVETLTELLVITVGYAVARLVLPLISLGRIEVESLGGSGAGFNWCGYRRVNGRVEIAATTAGFIGLLVASLGLALVMRTMT